MRTLAVGLTLAFVMSPTHAQMGSGRRHRGEDKQDQKAPKVDEKAYSDALKRIPEPKEKYDPWSGARPPTPERKQEK